MTHSCREQRRDATGVGPCSPEQQADRVDLPGSLRRRERVHRLQAMLEQGQHKELIAQYADATLDNKEALASLKTSIGLAQARNGAADAAT